MTALRITVLGGGSVGLAIAASYAQAGADVTLLVRAAAIQPLREAGITVSGVCGEHHLAPRQIKVSDVENPGAKDLGCDVLIVATKAYQVRDALARLMQKTDRAGLPRAVLLLQNGWGSASEVRDLLPGTVAVFSSIMMIGLERRTPSHVHINVQASPVRVGTLFGAAPEAMRVAVACGQAGYLPIVYEDAIEAAILNKFLFNTCLNALGALTRMTYGELLTNTHTRHLIASMAGETILAVQAERQCLLASSGVDYLENALTPLVMPKGAAHRSSMLQDVEAGRPTEIDYLNGAVVRMGQAHGLATPFNESIAALIRAREAGGGAA